MAERRLTRSDLSWFFDPDTRYDTGSLEAEFLHHEALFFGRAKNESPRQVKKAPINRQMEGQLIMGGRHQQAARGHPGQAEEGQAVGVGEENEYVEESAVDIQKTQKIRGVGSLFPHPALFQLGAAFVREHRLGEL